MNYHVELPITDSSECFEIRLESIGGLGANLCGKLLGELGALYLGLNSASFSSYGSEKRGSPVKSYIRWCKADRELRINSPVKSPDILGLFHEDMAGKMPVVAGVRETAKVVVNTSSTADQIRDRLRLCGGELWCVDALKIAMESQTRINMVMLGAIAKASGFVPLDAVVALVEDTVGRKYPNMLKQNVDGVQRGFSESTVKKFDNDGRYEYLPYNEARDRWGYANAPEGGVNPHFGSTVSNDLSASRQGYIPLFLQEKCINCGLCDTTCPDMVFQFEKGEYKDKRAMVNVGLDYRHCKGCLRCVAVCPTGALVSGNEREHGDLKFNVPNKDLVRGLEFEDAGANSWVTSEAYLDEKRLDGGMV